MARFSITRVIVDCAGKNNMGILIIVNAKRTQPRSYIFIQYGFELGPTLRLFDFIGLLEEASGRIDGRLE